VTDPFANHQDPAAEEPVAAAGAPDAAAGAPETGDAPDAAAGAPETGDEPETVDEPEPGTSPAPPAPEDELATARGQRDEFLDALQRLQADFENYKKRMAKQQSDHAARAGESLVEKLLPVLDVTDLAIAHGGGEEVKQIWTALVDVLDREGLERIDPSGGPFDPTRHDAVAHEPGEGGEQEVAEVLRAGYAWKGRVLRPAMVKVRG
jgi:molecular chaperone GrpE